MQDLDCLSDSSSIDDKEVDLYNFKKEYRKVYLKVEFLEQELYEKNLEIETGKNLKTVSASNWAFGPENPIPRNFWISRSTERSSWGKQK